MRMTYKFKSLMGALLFSALVWGLVGYALVQVERQLTEDARR